MITCNPMLFGIFSNSELAEPSYRTTWDEVSYQLSRTLIHTIRAEPSYHMSNTLICWVGCAFLGKIKRKYEDRNIVFLARGTARQAKHWANTAKSLTSKYHKSLDSDRHRFWPLPVSTAGNRCTLKRRFAWGDVLELSNGPIWASTNRAVAVDGGVPFSTKGIV